MDPQYLEVIKVFLDGAYHLMADINFPGTNVSFWDISVFVLLLTLMIRLLRFLFDLEDFVHSDASSPGSRRSSGRGNSDDIS